MSTLTNMTKTDSNIVFELVRSTSQKLTCCISVCRNYKNTASIIDLYPIPKNTIHRQLWCKTFSIPEEVAELPTARVCALHFRSKMGLPPLPVEVPRPPPDIPRDSSTIQTLADPHENFLAVSKDDSHLTMMETSCVVPANPSIPPEGSLDLPTTPYRSTLGIPRLEPDVPNVQNFESEVPNNTNSNVVKSSDDSSENNSVISSNMLLELECDDEPLSDIQHDIYVKDVMEFLTANETVYRLVHTPFSPKFPSMGKSSNEIDDKSNLASNSTFHYYPEHSNLQISGDSVSLPTLNPHLIQMPALNSSSINVLPSSFVLPPNTKHENSTVSTPSLSSPQMVPVNFSSTSVTDVTGRFSFLRDGNGQILNQNFSSNLSIDGNVVFSKSLTLSTSNANSILTSQLPSQLISISPNSLLTTGNLPLLQNINSECDNLKYSSNKNVTLNAVSILKNKVGNDNGAAVLSPSLMAPKFRLLTPLSTVQMFQNVNTPPVNASSSQQYNSTTLPSMISHPVNNQPASSQTILKSGAPASLPSTVAFSFAPIMNSSEFMRLINTSCSGPLPMSSLNSSKEQMRGIPVMSQVGLNSVSSASYQLMKLTEKARGSPSFGGYPVPASSTENVIPVALQRVETHYKSRPRPSVIDPSYVEEILPPAIKGMDHVYANLNDDHDSCDSPPLPVVPIVEYKSGDDALEDGVTENDCSNIPVIVDVISAREGAIEFFIEDKMPEILFDKSKKVSIESFGKDTDNSLSNDSDSSKKIESHIKDSESQFICYKSSSGDIIVSKLHSIFALQREIPAIPSGTELISNIRRIFSIKSGSLKNRLDDADNLRKRLKEEQFVSVSALWILHKKYFPKISPCNACGHAVFTLDRSDKFRDGFCYTCNNTNCRSQIPVQRPTFFERFRNFSLENLLLLTYHWACMSSLQEILTDIDLEVEDIWRYFKALQQLCRDINVKKGILGICPRSFVEASVVKLGNFFILGAYDRKSGGTRLEVLSEEEAFESMHPIKLLTRWLYPNATLICEQKIPDGVIPGIKTTCAEYDVTDPQCPLPHILNIYFYLTKGLACMFDKLNHHKLSKEFITGFLSERQWRDKFGRTVEHAFWTILAHIRDLNVSEVSTKKSATVIAGKLYSIPRVNSNNNELCQMRWGPFSTVKKVPQDHYLLVQKTADPPGVGKPIKSYSKPFVNIQPKLPVISNKLRVDDIASYFQDVPEIPGANLYLTSKSMLAIKIRFDESDHDANAYNVDAISLGLRLRKEGFISSPVRWLVKKGYIKSSSLCYVCNGTAYLRDNPKFSDGCSWSCQNKMCQFENVFKRPRFFSRFPQQPMAHISAMIFHWTVQSDTAIITSDAPMDLVKISHAWRAFQLLCCSALKRERCKIGGQALLVEVALVQYGKKYVLGAYDRSSKLSFLKAFHGHMLTSETLSNTLKSWINPGTYVIVNADKTLKLPPEYHVAFADSNVTDKRSRTYHVLNITSYLLNHVSFMFGHLRADVVRPEAMQVFLDELMWRERNGRKPQLAFSKIMHEIFYNEWSGKSYDITEDEKELAQESSSPIKLKEARIVLRRIPKTVLKYYNCLPSDSSEDKNTSSPFDLAPLTHPVSSVATCATLENLATPIPRKLTRLSRDNTTPTLIRKCMNEDEFIVVDDYDDYDNDSSLGTSRLMRIDTARYNESISKFFQNQGAPGSSKQVAEDKPTGYSSKSSNSGASTSHSMDSNKILTNSVQPLVINVCRKNKKPKFYIKSDSSSVTTSNENSVDGSIHDESAEEPPVKTESNLLRLTENSNSEPCTVSPLGEKIELESLRPSSSKLKRHIEEKHECIECGNCVSLDHFMKKFSCTDCKKNVYTTCCSNAFVEHRSSLLFGKRMPRRYKEHKGIHKSVRLPHSWFCNCGFSSVHGNQLASHLVKCEKTTCYRTNQSQ